VYDEAVIGDEISSSPGIYTMDESGMGEGNPDPLNDMPQGPGGDFHPDDNPPPPPGGGMYQGPEGGYQPGGGMYQGPEGEYHPHEGENMPPPPPGGEQHHADGGHPPHGEGGHPPHGEGGHPPHGEGGHPPHGEGGHPPHGEGEHPDEKLREVMKDAMDNGAMPEEAFAAVMEAANAHAMEDGVPQEQIEAANGAAQAAFDEAMANGATPEEAFAAVSEAVREIMPEPDMGMEPYPMGEGMHDGDTTPPHPDGHVNEFIAPLYEGLDYDGEGETTWTLPIGEDAVNIEENSFVIAAEHLGSAEFLPPEATDNGDGTYTINSWSIESVTDNGDGTVTLNVDIGMMAPESSESSDTAPPPPPPEGWEEPHAGGTPPPPPPGGEERGMFDKVMDAAKSFNPFK